MTVKTWDREANQRSKKVKQAKEKDGMELTIEQTTFYRSMNPIAKYWQRITYVSESSLLSLLWPPARLPLMVAPITLVRTLRAPLPLFRTSLPSPGGGGLFKSSTSKRQPGVTRDNVTVSVTNFFTDSDSLLVSASSSETQRWINEWMNKRTNNYIDR